MSVLIKGMAMPKDGVYWCEIGVADDIAMITIHGEDRKSFPLIEVPEPHGRLGDLDELKTAFPCGESIRTESVRATIDHMPTIIPASEVSE